jgi:hypothetical protein
MLGSFCPDTGFPMTAGQPIAWPEPASVSGWSLVTYSRQQIVEVFRRAGMDDIADAALATLPEQVDYETVDKFCAAHHLTVGFVMDRLGSTM